MISHKRHRNTRGMTLDTGKQYKVKLTLAFHRKRIPECSKPQMKDGLKDKLIRLLKLFMI